MKSIEEDSKLLRRGTKVIHNGQKCVVLNFRRNGKGYEYFLSDRKWAKRRQVRLIREVEK